MKTLSKFIGLCIIAAFATATFLQAKSYSLNNTEAEMTINVTRLPTFPIGLKQQGYSEGLVVIAFEVDHLGELRDWFVTEATHPEFVKSVERVIDSWDFYPPKIGGESRSIVSRLRVEFESNGSILSFGSSSDIASVRINEITGFRSESVKLANIHELDTYPKASYVVKPSIPVDVIDNYSGSKAVFTFYVDENGGVRIPALSQIDGDVEPGMLLAAQEALMQWKFEPPKKKSKPTNIRLAQTFVFSGK